MDGVFDLYPVCEYRNDLIMVSLRPNVPESFIVLSDKGKVKHKLVLEGMAAQFRKFMCDEKYTRSDMEATLYNLCKVILSDQKLTKKSISYLN